MKVEKEGTPSTGYCTCLRYDRRKGGGLSVFERSFSFGREKGGGTFSGKRREGCLLNFFKDLVLDLVRRIEGKKGREEK